MREVISVIVYIAATAVVGCLWGLIPFFLGRYRYRPNMGRLGLIWCSIAGPFLLSFFVMLGFVIAILVSERDARPARSSAAAGNYNSGTAVRVDSVGTATGLTVQCISGELRAQVYPLTSAGLIIGREVDCSIRFAAGSAGISRHHCSLRWQQGVPVLVDLDSSYGTYLGDGRRLPPNYPTPVGPGTRFYLANPNNLFQITTT